MTEPPGSTGPGPGLPPDRPGGPARERVRVTGPARRRTAPGRTRAAEIDAGSALGAVYLSSLLREQGRLAMRVLGALVALVGSLPLIFHLAPRLAEVTVAGVPLSWLLLALAIHPVLWLLGWAYVRMAEANEDDFAALLDEVADAPEDPGTPDPDSPDPDSPDPDSPDLDSHGPGDRAP